ncbi:MAG: NAD(P)/FAD-dependent oxidoreductase [Candidatus Nanopelagicales bacterium]
MSPSVVQGLPQVLAKLRSELDVVGTATYDGASDAARTLDEWSIAEWIEQNVEGGRPSPMGLALESTSALNLGFAATKSSALTLHNMFVAGLDVSEDGDGFSFGQTDHGQLPELHETVRAAMTQVMHVRGGNDRIVAALAERLDDGVLRMESPLTRLSRLADGRYEVEVRGDSRRLLADRVVPAVPLPCLREVDLDGAGLSPRRREAIAELPMGQGTKLLVQLDSRLSDIQSWPGFAVTDRPDVAFWDTSAGQPGASGLLTLFTSGCIFEASQPHAAATPDVLVQARALLADVLPGIEPHVTENAWLDSWPEDPWSQGSYAGFAPGQFTRYFGFLHLPEQGVHFAGEHTSMGSQGYLDGAVESGDRAAEEVLLSLLS